MQKWQFRLSRDEFDRRQKNWLRMATFVACLGGGAATQFLISLDAAITAFSAGIPSTAGELRILVFTSCFVIFAAILTTVRHATRRVVRFFYSASYHDDLRGRHDRAELLKRLQPYDRAA